MSSNFGLTTFATDGKLEQVSNALAAANNGETSIGKSFNHLLGLKTKEGIILASEKYITSVLVDETSFCKIANISKFMGATYSGLGPDFKVILKKARKDFQTYKLSFMDDLMPIHSLSREIANLMQVSIRCNARNILNQEELDHLVYAVSWLVTIDKDIIFTRWIPQEHITVISY